MKKMLKKSLVLAVSAGIATLSLQTQATVGYFSHGYGIKAKGMGGAGVALPQDSLAAATNPAGMVLVGNRWDVGAEVFVPDREARTAWGTQSSPPGVVTTYDGNGDGFGESWFLIPEIGYNKMVNKNLSWGVSVFGNGGMNTTWNAPIFSLSSGQNTGIDLSQLFISPTLSFKLDDKNSLGVSVNLVYQSIKIEGIADFTPFSSNGAKLTDNGYDGSYGVGFRVGWIGELTDTVSAGFTYQPKTNMKPFEDYAGLFAEGGDFDIPANYAFGVSWKTTPKLTLAFDVEQIKYSGVKSIANPNLLFVGGGGPLGAANGPGFGWEDMTVYKLGGNFQVNKDLVVRAGWTHGSQPIPAGQTLFNVLAPAVVEDHLTVGFTYKMSGGEVSGYYMHAFEETVNGSGTVAFPGAQNAGGADISMSQNAFGIAYGVKF